MKKIKLELDSYHKKILSIICLHILPEVKRIRIKNNGNVVFIKKRKFRENIFNISYTYSIEDVLVNILPCQISLLKWHSYDFIHLYNQEVLQKLRKSNKKQINDTLAEIIYYLFEEVLSIYTVNITGDVTSRKKLSREQVINMAEVEEKKEKDFEDTISINIKQKILIGKRELFNFPCKTAAIILLLSTLYLNNLYNITKYIQIGSIINNNQIFIGTGLSPPVI